MERHIDVDVVKKTQAFTALEEEWEDLYYDSPLATPFQSWSWLYSWWEAFGEGYELRLITVRHGSHLVGLIPLMLERRWGFRRLLFIGDPDRPDLLTRSGWEDKVCEAGVRALRLMGGWHVTVFRNLGPGAAVWGIYQEWNSPQTHMLSTHYPLVGVKPWDELLARLDRKNRSTVRRTLRRAEEDRVRTVIATPEETEQAGRRLVALHRELWQGRDIERQHLTSEFESFIVSAARRMTDRGLGRIFELWRDGQVLISSFVLFGDKVTHAYLVGVSGMARQRYQWSSLAIREALNIARTRNSKYVCLGAERAPYKERWASTAVPHYRVVMSRGLAHCRLYCTSRSLRERARMLLKQPQENPMPR